MVGHAIPQPFALREGGTGYSYLLRVVGAELQQLTKMGLARVEVPADVGRQRRPAAVRHGVQT